MLLKRSFLFLTLAYLLLTGNKISAQRECAFNTPGNACYFLYLCYTHDEDYTSSQHKPILFVLGKEGRTVKENFDNDTIRNLPQFYGYKIVYVPNRGGDGPNKLQCLEDLGSLVTFNYKKVRDNLFLLVCDPTIKQSDITASGIDHGFKKIRLTDSLTVAKGNGDAGSIAVYFKAKEEETPKAEEEMGTFYNTDTKHKATEVADTSKEVEKKTFFGAPQAFGFTLTGVVRDKATGEALPFATVQVKGTPLGASTNADGYFSLQKIPSDTSTLVIHYVGYDNTEIYLTPQTPKRNYLIEVKSSSHNLKVVTITSVREDVVLVDKTSVGVVKMTPKILEQLPNLGERDVMRSLQLMPGVSAANESSSGLYVRGGTPDQNLVLYDGFTVYQVDHLYGFFSAFNSNAIKDVQLYKGGFESRFGGRLSSVTEITGKDGNQKKWNIGGDISLLSMNAFVEIPIKKKFSSIIAFRRSYKGPIYDAIFNKFNPANNNSSAQGGGGGGGGRRRFQQQSTVSSYFYDLNGKFTYRPSDRDIFSLSVYSGTDHLDNSVASNPSFGGQNFNFSSTDLTKYGNIGGSLRWARNWTEQITGNTILSYSNYFSDRTLSQQNVVTSSTGEVSTSNTGVFENNNLQDFSLKSDYNWDAFSFAQIQFGAFATYYDIQYSYATNDTSTLLSRHDQSLLTGAYLQTKIKLFKDKLQFLPGIRTSYFQATNQMYYEPRASATFNLTPKLTLKAATGRYYQFANSITREDILTGSKNFWILADGSSVPVGQSIHYIAGLSYETGNYLFSTEGYYKDITDLTSYTLRFSNSRSGPTTYSQNFYNGYGNAKGIEFLVQKKSGKLNGWISYTLGQAQNHFDVYGTGFFPADQDVTNECKLVLLYKYRRWDFSATEIYATGRPYTAPSGAYTVTLLDGSQRDYFTVTDKNSLRLPDYHRADISITYKILGGVKEDLKRREIGYIGFSIFNVYNHTNVWYKQYSIVNGQILENDVTYLGITPNITLSLKLR